MVFARKHIDRQKGTPNKDHAMHLFGRILFVLGAGLQLMEAFDDSIGSEEAQNANVPIVVLAVYFCVGLIIRISWTPTIYRHLSIVTLPIAVFQKPRLGIFGQYYDALAFFFAVSLGELIGNSIDEMQRTNYILMQKSNQKLLKETRARAAAVEELLSYRENVTKEKEAKKRAARLADSLLNHTPKNIMADGIASVELYEQNGNVNFLNGAKLSMKHGMWWTRRRQSLFMVCQGTCHPKKEIVNLRTLLMECVNGRQIEKNWAECCTGLQVQTDATLLSLAFENGISNAMKHNRPENSNPMVTARVIPRSNSVNHSESSGILEVVIQNNATPGALFISEEVETRLFQEGMHGKLTTLSSDGIGLGHARMMTDLLGGEVSLRQRGDKIAYTIRVPTEWQLEEPGVALQNSPGGERKRHLTSIVKKLKN